MSDMRSLSPEQLVQLRDDVISALAKKRGHTWGEWWTSLDKTKLRGWVVIIITAIVTTGGTVAVMKSTGGPPLKDEAELIQAITDLDKHMAVAFTTAEKTAAAHHDAQMKAIKEVEPPSPPKPSPDDPPKAWIKFSGPTLMNVGGPPVDIHISLAAGATNLKVWASPETTSYVRVVDNVAIIGSPTKDGIIYLEAVCLVDGKITDPVWWRIVAGKGPQPPPTPDPPKPPTPDPPKPPRPGTKLVVEPTAATLGSSFSITATGVLPGDWVGLNDSTGKQVDWRVVTFDGASVLFTPTVTGPYKAILRDAASKELTSTTFVVGKEKDDPPDPPKPNEQPILGPGGMRVMIVLERSKVQKINHQSAIDAKVVRDYLWTSTKPTPDGAKRGFYIVDKDVDFSGEGAKVWGSAMQRTVGKTLPYVIVSSSKGNGETSFGNTWGPNELLNYLKKFEE